MFNAKADKVKKLPRLEEFSISTVIADDIAIEGDLIGSESLRIDGKVKGFVRMSKGVIIGESAYVEGDVSCETLIVYGHIIGDVRCKTLVLKSAGSVHGNVAVQQFTVDLGGELIGAIQIDQGSEPKLLETKAS